MICTVWIEGMVAIAPKVGRPSRQSWRRRLSGAGIAEVKAETPEIKRPIQKWVTRIIWINPWPIEPH
jgi:hypothetical protein